MSAKLIDIMHLIPKSFKAQGAEENNTPSKPILGDYLGGASADNGAPANPGNRKSNQAPTFRHGAAPTTAASSSQPSPAIPKAPVGAWAAPAEERINNMESRRTALEGRFGSFEKQTNANTELILNAIAALGAKVDAKSSMCGA